MNMKSEKQGGTAVIGAGAWGTAIASVVARCNQKKEVILYAREKEVVNSVNQDNENKLFLGGVRLPANILAVEEFDFISKFAPKMSNLFFVTPSKFFREYLVKLQKIIEANHPAIIICSKGIEQESLKTLSQQLEEILPRYKSTQNYAIFTGASFAKEVALQKPLVMNLASKNRALLQNITNMLASTFLQIKHIDDIITPQIGAAVKNVIAIACGVALGFDLGENFKASIFQLGLEETMRLAIKMGGDSASINSPAIIGDMFLTCSSLTSRNMSFGYELGKGETIEEIRNNRNTIAEGLYTAPAIAKLSDNLQLHTPVINFVAGIVKNGYAKEQDIYQIIK